MKTAASKLDWQIGFKTELPDCLSRPDQAAPVKQSCILASKLLVSGLSQGGSVTSCLRKSGSPSAALQKRKSPHEMVRGRGLSGKSAVWTKADGVRPEVHS
jgi:hypothetical protein